ncbi:MAG: class II fructose-bisphosphate aldolase [Nitrospinae bacterium]|nr:class II fructose-bisphosphate aldolase [Nitrospinota bacterium]
MKVADAKELLASISNCAVAEGGSLKITDPSACQGKAIDKLAYNAVFGQTPEIRGTARWAIKSVGIALGVWSASIQGLYEAMGRGEVKGYTVPAVNIRGMTYDVARALARTAVRNNCGTFIYEIAKSEIEYTFQRPAEYTAVMLAAAIKEGFRGPVFVQGDHFQVNVKKYKADPAKEVETLKKLIAEAVEGGFYNIDIDTSTLVDLSKPDLTGQQRLNFEVGAELTAHVRKHEPAGVTVSVGGEIGEVGEKNSTVEELVAYMDGYNSTLKKYGANLKGISKVSVQTGTTHGGVPLADGTIAKVKLDFDTLEKMSHTAREKYGLSGAVQHGASTLPDDAFHRFPETTTSEVHLATGFQNMVYDSPNLPQPLRDKMYGLLKEKFKAEWKEGQTEEQFIYKTRKKGFGLVKEEIWTLPSEVRATLRGELEAKFDFLFKKLGVVGNRKDVEKYVKPVQIAPSLEKEIASA